MSGRNRLRAGANIFDSPGQAWPSPALDTMCVHLALRHGCGEPAPGVSIALRKQVAISQAPRLQPCSRHIFAIEKRPQVCQCRAWMKATQVWSNPPRAQSSRFCLGPKLSYVWSKPTPNVAKTAPKSAETVHIGVTVPPAPTLGSVEIAPMSVDAEASMILITSAPTLVEAAEQKVDDISLKLAGTIVE